MSLLTLAAIALVATLLSQTNKTPTQVVKTGLQGQSKQGGHPLKRPTGPSQMWVDRPINTSLRNDAQGQTPEQIEAYLQRTYASEASVHPGVRLVAGQAVA